MIISVLTENNPGAFTQAEHGLSYFIEHDVKKLFFDTGQSDMFIKNAELMKLDISKPDIVILSHGHFDHGNGLKYLSGIKLICHPGCFVKRYRKADYSYIGLNSTEVQISSRFELIKTKSFFKISDKIIFLGEIPRVTDFESKKTGFVLEYGIPDFVMDDSAVALLSDKGLFVITGCGHAGIVNTLEHAKNITGEKRIYGIMGGFHLKKNDTQTKETIRYLKINSVKHVFPSHCTDIPALSAFYQAFKIKLVRTGDVLNF